MLKGAPEVVQTHNPLTHFPALHTQCQASPAPSHIVVLKGAPEVVRTFLATVPSDYDATYKRFAAQVSGLQCTTVLRHCPSAKLTRSLRTASLPSPIKPLRHNCPQSAQGARVIALARRALPPSLDGPELRGMGREAAEAEMQFMGFAVFQAC